MPNIWKEALNGKGQVDLSQAKTNANSQHLLIPSGVFGNVTKILTERAFGENVHTIKQEEWPDGIKNSGFNGSLIFMDEPVLDIPSVISALAMPYQNSIRKISYAKSKKPFEFLKNQNIEAKQIIFTTATDNHDIATQMKDDDGLNTQKRPLLQGMLKNAPFPLWGHLVGKTDKPVASITTHKDQNNNLIWYIGGSVAERSTQAPPTQTYNATIKAIKSYLPNVTTNKMEWDVLPINRIEGQSKTQHWLPDTPTIHDTKNALYCWPTKLTFAPMLAQMIVKKLEEKNITPSHIENDYTVLPPVEYAKTPWDKAIWKK